MELAFGSEPSRAVPWPFWLVGTVLTDPRVARLVYRNEWWGSEQPSSLQLRPLCGALLFSLPPFYGEIRNWILETRMGWQQAQCCLLVTKLLRAWMFEVQHCLAAVNQHSEPEDVELVSHFLERALCDPGPALWHLSTSVSRSIKSTLSTHEDQVRSCMWNHFVNVNVLYRWHAINVCPWTPPRARSWILPYCGFFIKHRAKKYWGLEGRGEGPDKPDWFCLYLENLLGSFKSLGPKALT